MDQISQCLQNILPKVVIGAIIFALVALVAVGVAGAFGVIGLAGGGALLAAVIGVLAAAFVFLAVGVVAAIAVCVAASILAQQGAANAAPPARSGCVFCNLIGLRSALAAIIAAGAFTLVFTLHR